MLPLLATLANAVGILELRMWACAGPRLRGKFRSRSLAFDPTVRAVLARHGLIADLGGCSTLVTILQLQLTGYHGDPQMANKHCVYQARCGHHTYLGRAAISRPSSRHSTAHHGVGKDTVGDCSSTVGAELRRISDAFVTSSCWAKIYTRPRLL